MNLLYQFFGLGQLPSKYAPTLHQEGIVLLDEGIGGSITLKRYKAPGRRHSWKRSWFVGSLVLTEKTFAAFVFARPMIYVPRDDSRLRALRCSAESGKLLVAFDASLFNEQASGTVGVRFKTQQAQLFLEHLV